MQQSIVLGIGSGRCGTRSLAQVLSRQTGVQVSHEDPPLLPWRREDGRALLGERFARFRRTRTGQIVGDVASFYLPYVEEAIASEPDIRIVCLKRPQEEVVQSFCAWLTQAKGAPINHWAQEPSPIWRHDPVWTQIFPQYATQNREDGIRRYWDEYYQQAEELAKRYPEHLRIFDTQQALNTQEGLRELFAFTGIPRERQVMAVGITVNKSASQKSVTNRRALDDPLASNKCAVLVPFLGQIYPKCDRALTELQRRGYAVHRVGGYAAVDQARNQMATDALRAGFEETTWVDADIDFHPDAIELLRSHKAPIVCGVYPLKGKRGLACHVMPGTETMVFGREGGLTEILYAGTGFLLVRRQVYETLQRDLKLPVCNERFGSPTVPFFQPMVHRCEDGHWYLAEDYAFCQRARECGFRILADTTIRLLHMGTYGFGWEDAGTERQHMETFTLHFPNSPSFGEQNAPNRERH